MKKDAYEELVAEISKQLAEKILVEEGDLTTRVKTIDGDIAVLLRDVGLRTSKLVLQQTCDEIVGKKNRRPETMQKQRRSLQCHFRGHGAELALLVEERRSFEAHG